MRKELLSLFISLVIILGALMPEMIVVAQQEVPYGPWVDEIIFFEESDYGKVIEMLEKGEMDIFLFTITDPVLFDRVKKSPNLQYKVAYGYYNELTLNPAEFKVGFNPFVNPRIREAMNYIIDREHIVNEIYKGLAKPKWLPFISGFPEYGRIADVIKLLEAKYAYNFEKGKEIVYEEMAKMGCEMKDGKWHYKDEPVVIKIIIRVEDERRLIGHYFADQLEKLGFKVDRLERTRREAAPIIYAGDPTEGLWHVYTGGWVSTAVSRDDSDAYGYFYTPLGYGSFMQYAKPDPLFYEVASRLWRADYKTWEERQELMAKGAEMALKDSLRVWIVDQISPFVSVKGLMGAADLSGGYTTAVWSRTVGWEGKVGGSVRAGSLGVLVDPWNPVAGTNWLYDAIILWTVNDYAFLIHPYLGLPMPNRVVEYTVEVNETGIPVPSDVWFDWDVKEKKVIYAPPGTYAKAKVRGNYGSILGKVKYHDGTVMTLADWVALWAFTFERANNPESPLYDESAVPGFREWRLNYRGFRIVSEDPFIIEVYTNYTHPEREFIANWALGWPNTPWHVTAIGILAEEKGLLAFSDYKAKKTGREWMNYIGGPSLSILASVLDEAIRTKYIPLPELASKYIKPEEAVARYNALKKWYEERGHFWVASGPFWLYKADFTAHQAVVKAFREYSFKADKFAWLAEPPIPEVTIVPPEMVVPGVEATFEIKVSYAGKPYPSDRIESVKYLMLDAQGNLLGKGSASLIEEGSYKVVIPSLETGKMSPGTYTFMVVASSKDVAVPAIKEAGFIVIPPITYFQTLLQTMRSELEAKISAVQSSVTPLERTINELQSSLNTVTLISTVAVIIAIVSIALNFILMRFRK